MSSSSLPKWQLALVVGAPVAIGLSYMYYRNRSDSGSKISPTRDGALADKALSIDDHATNKSTKVRILSAEAQTSAEFQIHLSECSFEREANSLNDHLSVLLYY